MSSWKKLFSTRAVMTIALGVAAMSLNGTLADAQTIRGHVTNSSSNTAGVFDLSTNVPSQPIPVGATPFGVALTPNGADAYIANFNSGSISVVDTSTSTVVNNIQVGGNPRWVTISPDGFIAYVTVATTNVLAVINTVSQSLVSNIPVGESPEAVAVTPNGSEVYVTSGNAGTVSVISASTNVVTATIPIGSSNLPIGVACTPDGLFVYVVNQGSNTVTVISTTTHAVVRTISGVGLRPFGIAIAPDGSAAWVTDFGSNTVARISLANDQVIGFITVGASPWGIAFNSSGASAFIADYGSMAVSVVGTSTLVVSTINVGAQPIEIALQNPVSPPRNLSATVGNQTVTLRWEAPVPFVSGYNIYLNGVKANSSELIQGATVPVVGLQNGQIYQLGVTAVSNTGESSPATIFAEPNAFVAPPHPLHPILFLHGINADATAWETTSDFLTGTLRWTCGGTLVYAATDDPRTTLPHWASPSDHAPSPCRSVANSSADYFTADFGDNLANYTDDPDSTGIFRQGDETGGFIEALKNHVPLSIVAWSMGGLSARSYMQVSDPIDAPTQISDLITLGTPQWGVNRSFILDPENSARFLVLGLGPVLTSRGLFDMNGGCVSNGRMSRLQLKVSSGG